MSSDLSRVYRLLHVLPRLPWLQVFPRLALVTGFPAFAPDTRLVLIRLSPFFSPPKWLVLLDSDSDLAFSYKSLLTCNSFL